LAKGAFSEIDGNLHAATEILQNNASFNVVSTSQYVVNAKILTEGECSVLKRRDKRWVLLWAEPGDAAGDPPTMDARQVLLCAEPGEAAGEAAAVDLDGALLRGRMVVELNQRAEKKQFL
jgi:hypothetical protein